MAKNTPEGSYTVIVRATAAGNASYDEGSADSAVTVIVTESAEPVPAGDIEPKDRSITIDPTKAGYQYVAIKSSERLTEEYWAEHGKTSERGEAITFEGLENGVEYSEIGRASCRERVFRAV